MSSIRNFFYAEDDAQLYDATVDLTTESYGLLHAQIARLVRLWSARRSASHAPCILDVGAGTGAEALSILRALPDAELVCIDASPRMLAELHRKVAAEFGDSTAGGRCTTIVADAYAPDWADVALARTAWADRKFDLVVSVYLYHHLDAAAKAPAYSAIASRLRPGGVFIHGDLFSYADPDLARYAQELEDDWLTSSFQAPGVVERLGLAPLEAERLVAAWLRHYHEENRPLPMEPEGEECDAGTERGVLRGAGFREVEIPFRFFQNGIMWAKR